MNRYLVTYVQEVTQRVSAETLQEAGDFAKRYAANKRALHVLTVYPIYEALPEPPAVA